MNEVIKPIFDMAPCDLENTNLPEEVAYYAKEIFDHEIQIEVT